MRWLLVTFFAGCWTAPPPPPTAPKPAALPPLPPCPIALVGEDEQHLVVNETDLGKLLPEGEDGKIELAVYQTGAEAWVSYRGPRSDHGPRGSDTMWKVSCAGTKLETLTVPGANFGNAALHPDRRRLFYSSGKVAELDLATRKRRFITNPGTVDHCWDSGKLDEPLRLGDTVTGVTADHVEFTRGGPCGFEAEYDGVLMRHHLITGVEEPATSIASAIEVGDEVWIGMGDCTSTIYRSRDWKTWTKVALPDTLRGPLSLHAKRGKPELVVAKAGNCEAMGKLMLTEDRGKTWREATEEDTAMSWDSHKTIGELAEQPNVPATSTVRGRRVTLTNFGLLDAITGERLYPTMMRALIITLVGGCWATPAPPPVKPVVLAALPSCPIKLVEDTQHLIVNGVDLGRLAADGIEGTIELATYQTGAEAWVSYRGPRTHHGPRGSDTLWKVSCAGRKLDTLTVSGADFGDAALHPDRKRLLFSWGGVGELDLATRKRRAITEPGKVEQCWESEGPRQLADHVVAVTRDHVDFARGGPCGFEAEYDGVLMRRHLETGVEETATPIGSVIEIAGEIWVGSSSCDGSSIQRSTDWKTWTTIALPPGLIGSLTLVGKTGEPDHVFVQAGSCGYQGGGGAVLSNDRGKTWKTPDDADLAASWNDGKTLGETAAQIVDSTLPQSKVIRGRRVTLTNFGILDATTGERLFPR